MEAGWDGGGQGLGDVEGAEKEGWVGAAVVVVDGGFEDGGL